MPFWRRRRDEPPQPEVDEPVDPSLVDPDWEPDPADFGDLDDGMPVEPLTPTDPLLPFEPEPPTRLTIEMPAPVPVEPPPTPSWAEPVRDEPAPTVDSEAALEHGLERTRGNFMSRLRTFLGTGTGEGPSWEDVEETLIAGDVGAALAIDLVERARSRREPGGPVAAVRAELAALLVPRDPDWSPQAAVSGGPAVILVVGVNGTGKTTTIGKLAWHLHETLGQTVLLGAADTFRAAAVEQLEEWARRAGCEFVKGPPNSDPGSVAFDAVKRGRELGVDVVIVDTAGRLHTQDDLMAELAKIRRVIERQMADAPHETLLTVDATTGQNGLRQAKLFSEAVPVDGIVLTKLDGTAKGGIALAIAGELGIPVKLIGIGESLEDLRPFDPDDFARALLDVS